MTTVERALASQIATDHNTARAKAGLGTMHEYTPLAPYAAANGERMRDSATLGHSEIITLLDDFPRNMWAAENSLVMFDPATAAVGHWLDSAPHAQNMLAERATHIWVDVRCAADGRMWVTTQLVERDVDAAEHLPGSDARIADASTSDLRCPIATGPFDSADEFIAQQYADFLGREPDAEGLAYWADLLNTNEVEPAGVVLNFLNSAEFSGRIRPHAEAAMLASPTLPTADEVDLWRRTPPRQALVVDTSNVRASVDVLMIYVGMLDRSPDAEGFEYWTVLAEDGASLDALVDGFLVSAEYANRVNS